MPYVKIEVIEGISREQKAGLVSDVTQSLVDRLGKRPGPVFVVIQEVCGGDGGPAGPLVSERMISNREDANVAVPSQ